MTTDDDIVARTRDYLSHRQELKDGLIARRIELVKQRAELDVAIGECDKMLAELGQGPVEALVLPEPGAVSKRTLGVKKVVEAALRRLKEDHTWSSQELVIETAHELDARVQGKSVVSSLGRLIEEGVVLREGKRGAHRYALANITVPEQAEVPEISPPELILGKLKTSGPDGCTKKDLAWVVGGDLGVLEPAVDKLLASGDIIVSGEGPAARYKLAARVQNPRPLFGGGLDDVASAAEAESA